MARLATATPAPLPVKGTTHPPTTLVSQVSWLLLSTGSLLLAGAGASTAACQAPRCEALCPRQPIRSADGGSPQPASQPAQPNAAGEHHAHRKGCQEGRGASLAAPRRRAGGTAGKAGPALEALPCARRETGSLTTHALGVEASADHAYCPSAALNASR